MDSQHWGRRIRVKGAKMRSRAIEPGLELGLWSESSAAWPYDLSVGSVLGLGSGSGSGLGSG